MYSDSTVPDGLADRALVAAPVAVVHAFLVDRDLRIGRPHGAAVVGLERMRPVAEAAGQPAVVLLGFHHEGEQRLGRIREARVLEHHRIQDGRRLRRRLRDAARHRAHARCRAASACVAGSFFAAKYSDTPFAVRNTCCARKARLLRRIEPGQRAVDEGRIQLLQVVQRREGLRAVDGDLAVVIDHGAAMRPQQPVRRAIAVAHRVAEREAAGLVDALQRLHQAQEACVILRDRRVKPASFTADLR